MSDSALKQGATRGCFLKLLDQFYLVIAYSSLYKAHSSLKLKVAFLSHHAGEQRAINTRHNMCSNAIQYNLCNLFFFFLSSGERC